MKVTIPELALVVMIGPSGSGKSSFARKHFKPTEVLSSDYCRGLVSDDENDQAATTDAFEVLHFVARKRLAAGRLTVVDATNVQSDARKPLVQLARDFHCLPVAIVFNLPERLCHERNRGRTDRDFGPHVIRQQTQQLRRGLRGLEREGFRHVFVLSTPEEVEAAVIERQPLWNNLKHEHGPFDIIGDVHGCYDELIGLLAQLGYRVEPSAEKPDTVIVKVPEGRKAIFLGDLVDRGPKIREVLRLVMGMVESGTALCVPGNHDVKLMRKLRGRDVQITHGLADSLAQLAMESEEFRRRVADFIDDRVSHYLLDDGKLVVAHAGMKESMQGRGSGKVREFALYGETTGETDEFKDHVWHMTTLAKLCSADAGLLLATPYKVVDVTDEASQSEGIRWWEELTAAGGEGIVVKPMEFIVTGRRGLAQHAVKCRGREYLRIIYGPEYTAAENLERLRSRGLSSKRSLAVREFALGIEALERFVRREPLRRVHECVFAVLALESEPVDPRL
jgi:predicted kinase